MMNRTSCVLVALLIPAALAACDRDPQAAARQHFERGNERASARNYAEAIIEYRRAVQADPRLGEARLQLAHAYASTGDGINALHEYVRAAELLPEDTDAQQRAGTFLLLAGQFGDAEGLADRMLERDANSVEAHVLKANALAGLKDIDGAVASFEKAVELDPQRSTTYAELGALQLTVGKSEAAEAAFRKAIAINPMSATAHLALANFLLATRKTTEAEQSIRRALELEPKNLVANRAIARHLLMTGREAEAEPHLTLVADASPGPEPKYFLAEYYVRRGDLNAARATLTPLQQSPDSYVGASVRLARVEVLSGRHDAAHRVLEGVLAKQPRNAEALVTLGKLQLSEGNTVNALSNLTRAVEADSRSIDARIALAGTYAVRGAVRESVSAYNEALNIDASHIEARLGLARLLINDGQAAEAVPLALKIVADHPRHLEARLLLLHGLMAVGDLPQATHQLGVLMSAAPELASVQTAAGMLATLKKDTAAARQAYGRALAADPRSYQALAGLLSAEMQGKQFGNAKALIEKQLAQSPDDANVLMIAAETYSAIGDAFEMEKALKRTVEVDPQSLQAYAMLGRMYYQQGRLDLARRELETYVTRAPESVPANTMLGTILQLQGREDEAKARYNKALQIDPRAAVAANNLAWLDANAEGNLDVALQMALTAKTRLPNRHEIDDTIGWIYYKKGLSSKAIESLTASVTKQPDNPSYNYHLALAHHQSGNTAEAKKFLHKALQSKANFASADEARKLLESMPE